MEEFKGTKGKWKYEVTNKLNIVVQIPNNRTLVLGKIYDDDCLSPECCRTEEHANAKLIACAPELLHSLNEILKWSAHFPQAMNEEIETAKALIKKATL